MRGIVIDKFRPPVKMLLLARDGPSTFSNLLGSFSSFKWVSEDSAEWIYLIRRSVYPCFVHAELFFSLRSGLLRTLLVIPVAELKHYAGGWILTFLLDGWL